MHYGAGAALDVDDHLAFGQRTGPGRPLHFYAHEDPGQVLCHNVDLNGGFWWAVGADGERWLV